MIPRLIPALLMHQGALYKSIKFDHPKYIGDPINCIKIFNEKEVDEIILLDIGATKNDHPPDFSFLSKLTCEAFMPFSYGGGISSIEQAKQLFNIGIEKLIFNNALFSDCKLVESVSRMAGSSSVIASLDIKRNEKGLPCIYSYLDRQICDKTSLSDFVLFVQELGVGEIFLNSVDRDGMMDGFDLEVIHDVCSLVDIPVVACGGAGNLEHFTAALEHGASAVAAGSLFSFKGKFKAVLPNYPTQDEIQLHFSEPKSLDSSSKLTSNNLISNYNYQQCVRCVMDNFVDKLISFDSNGVCHHCRSFDRKRNVRLASNFNESRTIVDLVNRIKASSGDSEYDCLIGLSGGVDSSFVAYLVKSYGLNPLAIHFDNGWNSELAVKNIESLVDILNIDLITYVVDWDEFRELQLSFLKSSTPDCEIPTDHGIFASMWKHADQYNIKYIISGMNYHTESMSIPNWSYGHSDWKYIKSVHSRFSGKKLSSYPRFTPLYLFYLNFIRRIKTVSILNYIPYDKAEAIKTLQQKLNWVPYEGKHHESIYTRFIQGYYLPLKFNIDKRYCHMSDLINIGQLTRHQAVLDLKLPTYDPKLQQLDKQYVLSKLQLDPAEFDSIANLPVKSFKDYPNSRLATQIMKFVVHFLRRFNVYPK